MKKIIYVMALTAFVLLFASCLSNQKNTNNIGNEQKDIVLNDNLYGIYNGTLPAADCAGIQTSLTLYKDTSYKLVKTYLQDKNKTFETCGVYECKNDSFITLIEKSTYEKSFYKIADNALILLDRNGGEIKGDLAKLYRLEKQ